MKFRFCGDGDCPDWVLAEIISSLSILSESDLEILARIVAKKIVGEEFDEDKIKSITKALNDDGKSTVACVHFLIVSAARHNVNGLVFSEELQQLGLPTDHADSMCKILSEFTTQIQAKLMDTSLRVNELISFKCQPAAEETFNCAQIELKISQELVNGLPQDTTRILNIDKDDLKSLLDDLREAKIVMDEFDLDSQYHDCY